MSMHPEPDIPARLRPSLALSYLKTERPAFCNFGRAIRTLYQSCLVSQLATDRKIKQWFKFALFSVKADKRSRREIKLHDQLRTIEKGWKDFLDARQITLRLKFADGYDPVIHALEIDLDSIFNNLLLNSVEAFVLRNHAGMRLITINVDRGANDEIMIDYRDSGPGIDPNYRMVSQIFNFGETTKTGIDGNGTGIGMWILDSVVKEYGGRVEAFRPSADWGFKTEIRLPERRRERA